MSRPVPKASPYILDCSRSASSRWRKESPGIRSLGHLLWLRTRGQCINAAYLCCASPSSTATTACHRRVTVSQTHCAARLVPAAQYDRTLTVIYQRSPLTLARPNPASSLLSPSRTLTRLVPALTARHNRTLQRLLPPRLGQRHQLRRRPRTVRNPQARCLPDQHLRYPTGTRSAGATSRASTARR